MMSAPAMPKPTRNSPGDEWTAIDSGSDILESHLLGHHLLASSSTERPEIALSFWLVPGQVDRNAPVILRMEFSMMRVSTSMPLLSSRVGSLSAEEF
jgi:hypothetical protein